MQTDKEKEELCEALAATIEMTEILKEKAPETIELRRFTDEVKEIPMLEQKNGVYVPGKVKVPKEKPNLKEGEVRGQFNMVLFQSSSCCSEKIRDA